ncbi:DUF397 domain-containing protein [Nocardia sp. NPDC059764]
MISNPHPSIEPQPGDGTILRDSTGTTLHYTAAEWTAFTAGIRAGEFQPA